MAHLSLRPPTIPTLHRLRVVSSATSDSYLHMWKKAVERQRDQTLSLPTQPQSQPSDDLRKKTQEFGEILAVPAEERDRVHRMQVVDRAKAAIAAAKALVKKKKKEKEVGTGTGGGGGISGGLLDGNSFKPEFESPKLGTPGPDFWSWSPPENSRSITSVLGNLQPKVKSDASAKPSFELLEKETSLEALSIPFQSTLSQTEHSLPLPPLQSIVELEKTDTSPSLTKQPELDDLFSSHAAEAAAALDICNEASTSQVNVDGSKLWRETGIETRPNGVVCRWTLTRGVSADGSVEWEDKYWEASDRFDYKELGSEKSGRDAAGNVWREYWKESMWQDLKSGLPHMEKTADKWGKDTRGGEWHEKWLEHYDASGKAEKWADKWCSIDPTTPLLAGHAHTWQERWGEKYDGKGGSVKYTDKWAERKEGDGWAKWGDKWDENFNLHGHGVKQGETWWEGKDGDRWNRTWGEQHNGSGWIQKYGQSSSGEHWDTHAQEETWYERYPHFGFMHCFRNSVKLREVRKPPS